MFINPFPSHYFSRFRSDWKEQNN